MSTIMLTVCLVVHREMLGEGGDGGCVVEVESFTTSKNCRLQPCLDMIVLKKMVTDADTHMML